MNRLQREKFFKKVEAKYSVADLTGIIDPWKNQIQQPVKSSFTIRESDIFQTIKNFRNIMMMPKSYTVEYPEGNVVQPWGATVTFKYMTEAPKENHWFNSNEDKNIINQVESLINSRLGSYIHSMSTSYDGENADGKGIYTVTITQKSNTL